METKQFASPITLLKNAIGFYRRHFKTIIYLLALPVVLRIVWFLLQYEDLTIPFLVTLVATLALNLLVQIAFILLISDNGARSARDYFSQALKLFWPFLRVTVLAGLASIIATIFLVVPGIIVMVWYLFASLLVVVENRRGREALSASHQYVRGHWWLVFGRLVFLVLIFILAFIIIDLAVIPLAFMPRIQEIVSLLISGLIFSPIGLFYFLYLYRELAR